MATMWIELVNVQIGRGNNTIENPAAVPIQYPRQLKLFDI